MSKQMRIHPYIFILLFVIQPLTLDAQRNTSVSIKASASVIDKSEIELITMKNLDIDINNAKNGKVYISAQRDPQAALVKVKGKPDAYFRMTFSPVVVIKNQLGKGKLTMNYEMYGLNIDKQNASEPIDGVDRRLQINKDGWYYIWLGGDIDIKDAKPGKYDGLFTIEIEYI